MAKVKAAGIVDYRAHALSRPPLTELLASLQIYETGAQTGCPAHVVHCSLSRGYEIARSYRGYGFPMGELIGEGNVGLMQALAKFDPDRAQQIFAHLARLGLAEGIHYKFGGRTGNTRDSCGTSCGSIWYHSSSACGTCGSR